MVSTKWTKDNDLLIYENDNLVGTGKLILIDGKYFIDNVSDNEQFIENTYKELAVRMLVRRAINMGANKTYAKVNKNISKIFEKVGFTIQEEMDNDHYLMCKEGDVKGHCCQ